jgi:hypothetical protein
MEATGTDALLPATVPGRFDGASRYKSRVSGERVNGRVRVPDHVVHRDFGEQTVLLNLATGQYHGLNRTGRRMFELLEERGSLEGVAAQLAAEYQRSEAEVAADLVDLCAALSERGLLELDVSLRG